MLVYALHVPYSRTFHPESSYSFNWKHLNKHALHGMIQAHIVRLDGYTKAVAMRQAYTYA